MAIAPAEIRTPDVRLIGGNYQLDIAVVKGSCRAYKYCPVSEYDKTHIDVAAI